MVIHKEVRGTILTKGLLDAYVPPTGQSDHWKHGKSPEKYAPDKMATMGIYQNKNGHLPDAPGRVWYEADINYYSGRRNAHRLLWSNDGLIFVTYDHYTTFMEII